MTFTLEVAVPEDLEEIIAVDQDAMSQDWLFIRIFRNVSHEDHKEFFRQLWEDRLKQPNIKIFKMIDCKTGKIVAWAGLQYPLDLITEPVSSTQLTNPPGIDEELGALVGGKFSRGMSTEAGYNPKADFHRAATRTATAYQRQGLASRLADHCSSIADLYGRKLWVTARPAAVRLCEKPGSGFKKIRSHEMDMKQFGLDGTDVTMCYVREPRLLNQ